MNLGEESWTTGDSMKKTIAFVAVAILSIAGIALAQESRIDLYQFAPQWFTRGIYVGPQAPNVSARTANRVGKILGLTVSTNLGVNFDGGTSATGCQNVENISLTGAAVGDLCIAELATSGGAEIDGGFPDTVKCRVVAANTVQMRVCPSAEAASWRPITANYSIRLISP